MPGQNEEFGPDPSSWVFVETISETYDPGKGTEIRSNVRCPTEGRFSIRTPSTDGAPVAHSAIKLMNVGGALCHPLSRAAHCMCRFYELLDNSGVCIVAPRTSSVSHK